MLLLIKTATDEKTKKFGRAQVTGGKGTATRTVGLLGGILNFAVDRGFITMNPVIGVKRFPDKKSDRFLKLFEIQRLVQVMEEERLSGTNVQAHNIISLLLSSFDWSVIGTQRQRYNPAICPFT